MSAVAGIRGTGDWATDERPKDFREYILWRNPNGTTPINALMGKTGSEKCTDSEFSWWDEPVAITRLQVNVAVTLTAADTVITVDSADNDASNPSRVWGLATHCVPGDLLMVEPTTDAASFTTEIVRVDSVQSTTQLTVARGAAGTTASTIANDVFLLKIGSAFAEGTAEPKATSRNPTKYFNYTQIFKTTYDVTGSAAATKTRTGDVLKNDRKRRAFDHSKDIEFALLFGRRYETTGSNGKPLRYFGGIRSFIPAQNTTVFTGTPTMTGANNFLDAVYKVFDYDTEAGRQRIAICGNGALNALNKMIARDSNVHINSSESITMYGMELQKIVLPQGTIYLKTHPLLNQHSLYTNSMWLMDFSALKWRYLDGRDTDFTDNIQPKGEDAIRGQWMTDGGLEVRYGGLTLGYLGHLDA